MPSLALFCSVSLAHSPNYVAHSNLSVNFLKKAMITEFLLHLQVQPKNPRLLPLSLEARDDDDARPLVGGGAEA